MAVNPFLQLDVMKKTFHKGKQIYDCYRLMYRKDLWVNTHKQLFLTTPDQYELEEIELLITYFKKGIFRFSKCKGQIPLSVSYRETMVVEVINYILSSLFLDQRYYIPPYITAAKKMKKEWHVKDVFIIGEFKQPSDPIQDCMKVLGKTINDHRFLLLLHDAFQAERISIEAVKPFILSIYLREWEVWLKRNMYRDELVNTSLKRIEGCWSSNQFVIGVSGLKQETIRAFKKSFPVDMNDSIVLSTLKKPVLIFDYSIRKCDKSNKLVLDIPLNSLLKLSRPFGDIQGFTPAPRPQLLNYTENKILRVYHTELIRAVRKFGGVNKSRDLNKLFSLARGSFIKTIAMKRKCSVRKTSMEMRSYKQGLLCIKVKGKLYPFLTLKQLSFLRF